MMTEIAGTPFTWLTFSDKGALDASQAASLASLIGPAVTDLVVISHGWKTDQEGAWQLYERLWTHVRTAWPREASRPLAGFVVAGTRWPSKPFRTNFDNPAPPSPNVLGLSPSNGGGDLSEAAMRELLGDFEDLVGREAGAVVREQAFALRDGLDARTADLFAETSRAALPSRGAADAELDPDNALYMSRPGRDVLVELSLPPVIPIAPGVGGALGLGETLTGLLAGPRAAVARFLNELSYYEMKARAGLVGEALGRTLSGLLHPDHPVRLHLVGHSFGARLVTAAAKALPSSAALELHSLTLLQGAFSQNSMAESFPSSVLGSSRTGPFCGVVGKVAGPISITYTHNDSSCTLAYALASRLSRDTAKSIGDASDEFGAMGANGAQHLDAGSLQTIADLAPGSTYSFKGKCVHNIKADACINEHMDVANAEVGRFLATALNA